MNEYWEQPPSYDSSWDQGSGDRVNEDSKSTEQLPIVRSLGSLSAPPNDNDPNELIEHRFLYLGGILLLIGQTGIGKSSLILMIAIFLAIGKALFGINPGSFYRKNGMRILLIQAENDEGDLAEMRDGVLAGCDLTEDESRMALTRIDVCTINDKSGEDFGQTLKTLLTQHGAYNLVIIDPAFAYLGGDSNSQKDVSKFMRNLLNPLLHQHQIGLILVHHTNKPIQFKDNNGWKGGDFAYSGAGSAEWINPARAAFVIRSVGSDKVFELIAPKRGKRLQWKDSQGIPTTTKFIAHHQNEEIICWREAKDFEVEELGAKKKGGRPREFEPVELLHCIAVYPGKNQSFYKREMEQRLNCSKTNTQNLIKEWLENGRIDVKKMGQQKFYRLTELGQIEVTKQPSSVSWKDHSPKKT